jgi:hypothetical protein
MSLQAKIDQDITSALKNQFVTRLGVLRQLKSAMGNAALLKGNIQTELSDAEVIQVIRKQVTQRNDSIEVFERGNRNDLAVKEKIEKGFLEEYLPASLSDDTIDNIIGQAIEKVGATSKKDMGKVMKLAAEMCNGQVDNKILSGKIGKLLV